MHHRGPCERRVFGETGREVRSMVGCNIGDVLVLVMSLDSCALAVIDRMYGLELGVVCCLMDGFGVRVCGFHRA